MAENVEVLAETVVAFVNGLELPRASGRKRAVATDRKVDVFEAAKKQAMVVGGDIVSFVEGTPPNLREAIVNYTLLAQLAANRKVTSRDDIRAWYEAYFDVLDHLGWVVQERGFSRHHERGEDFEAHEAILSVAAAVLGPGTALAVVTSTLAAMKKMSDGPWMTVFRQESETARAARFQVTIAGPASDGGVTISMMAFDLNARTTLTHVLFVKYRSLDVELWHSSGKVSVDAKVLSSAGPAVAKKVADYVQRYVENIPI